MTRAVFIEDRNLMLEALKSSVDWLSNGIEPLAFFSYCDDALDFILEKKPDVVVTDIVMHGKDGLELIQYLHDKEMDIKVIIVSAYSRFEYAQRALQAGVFDYFEKPLDFNALIQSILRAGKANAYARQTKSFILEHRDIYRERFFTRLLLGQVEQSQSIWDEADFLHLENLHDMICVAFKLSAEKDPVEANVTLSREFRHLMLKQNLSELFGEDHIQGPYSLHNDEAAFVLLGCGMAENSSVTDQITQLVEKYAQPNRLILQAGIGSRTDDPEKLNVSYEEARRALDACFTFGENCVIHIDDLKRESTVSWLLLNRFETRLVHAFGMQDIVELQNAIALFRQEINRVYLQRGALKVLLKGIVFKAASMNIALEISADTAADAIESSETLGGMLDILETYLLDMCREVRNDRNRQGRQLFEQAKAYIDENYDREQFSLNEVAVHIAASPNYLCSVFKREYGSGMHEYLTQLRMQRARELLIHTDMSVGSVGMRAGYSNPYHFSMNFKKYTGMTPTEFRRKNQSSGGE